MSKRIQDPEENPFDNISASRYISHMKQIGNGNKFQPPKISAEYVGEKGLLFRADCLDLLANIRESSVDLIFVDPPFNLGKDYNVPTFNDDMETEAYRSWCHAWLLELTRILRPGGTLFLYHWPRWAMELGAWMNTLPALEYKAWIALKMKSGFPIKGRIHPAHYGLLYYVKRGVKPTFNVVRTKTPTCRHCGKLVRDYGGYRKKFERFEDEKGIPWIQISDFWEDTRPARQDKSRENQINELPLHIPERAILLASNPGDVVLDCFAGGGSTLHAAQLHNRLWIGGEYGQPVATLKRIKTFIGDKETPSPPNRLLSCFNDNFRDTVIRVDVSSDDRPIKSTEKIEDAAGSMEKFASKSKVIGF
jgi:site-specific DNA-methyltransferase (adenine-specific)